MVIVGKMRTLAQATRVNQCQSLLFLHLIDSGIDGRSPVPRYREELGGGSRDHHRRGGYGLVKRMDLFDLSLSCFC